jgi:hypothetical protein
LNVCAATRGSPEGAGDSGGGVNPGANSGSSVLEIDGQATSFDFGALNARRAVKTVSGKYRNESSHEPRSPVSSLSVTGAGFSLQSPACPETLTTTPPGNECSLPSRSARMRLPLQRELAVSFRASWAVPSGRSLSGAGVSFVPAIAFAKVRRRLHAAEPWGASSQAPLSLTNTGGAALAISSITSSSADFSATHDCSNVAANAGCTISITFAPTAAGIRLGYLTVTSNASVPQQTITVSGSGVASIAVPLALVAVKSRKVHDGTAHDLDVDAGQLVGGAITVEPRAGTHQVVFQFNGAITATGTATAKDAANNNVGSVSVAAKWQRGRRDDRGRSGRPAPRREPCERQQRGVNASAAVGFLAGDVDGTRSVTASDILRVKGRAAAVNDCNFVHDIDASGTIDPSDVAAVKQRAGLSL